MFSAMANATTHPIDELLKMIEAPSEKVEEEKTGKI